MTARDETLIALWRDDVPIPVIAKTLDMTTNAVHGLACRLRQLGHDLPRRPTGPRPKSTRLGTPVRADACRHLGEGGVVGLDLRLHLQTPDTAGWSYSGFARFRERVCRDAGLGEIGSYVGFGGTRSWPEPEDEPLVPLLNHSDCDGELWGWQCDGTGARLRAIVEAWPSAFPDDYDRDMGLRLASMLERVEVPGGVVEFS